MAVATGSEIGEHDSRSSPSPPSLPTAEATRAGSRLEDMFEGVDDNSDSDIEAASRKRGHVDDNAIGTDVGDLRDDGGGNDEAHSASQHEELR